MCRGRSSQEVSQGTRPQRCTLDLTKDFGAWPSREFEKSLTVNAVIIVMVDDVV